MSYYSDVAIVIFKRDAKRLFDEVQKRPEGDIIRWFVLNRTAERDSFDIDDHPDGVCVMRWDGVKWYEEFDEVKFVMEFIHSLGDGNYEFMRIGEEDGDVEHEGDICGEQCLLLERNISFELQNLPWIDW